MPKLPDIEYAIVQQGPPNVVQAFGAAAQTADTFQGVQNEALRSFAIEQGKTQTGEADLILAQGLAPVEAELSKPYIPRSVVQSAFPDGMPSHVEEAVRAAGEGEDAQVPTYLVARAIHAEAAKSLATFAAGRISSAKFRSDFEQRTAAELQHRNAKFEMRAVEQGVQLMGAQALAQADSMARTAVSDADWARVFARVESSNALEPAQKEKALSHFMGLRDTQGKQRTAAGLAEGALAAGRDGVSPWVDAGKAQAAFEASVQGKDPLVVEDARQRFTRAIAQADAARQASDAPTLGRLETVLYRGGGLSRISDDYKALSPQGQAHIERLAEAERRQSRSARSEERQAQADLDARAVLRFKALDLGAQVGVDPYGDSIDAVLGDPEFKGISKRARDVIAVEKKGAQKVWQRDQGVSEADLMKESDDLAVQLGFKKKGARTEQSELFEAYMRSRYREWVEAQPPDGPKKPPVEKTREWFRGALDYGDKGGMHLSGNKYRFQAKPGEDFTTEGFESNQKGHKKLDALQGPAPKRVQGAEIGQPGGVWELLPNGKYKRVE